MGDKSDTQESMACVDTSLQKCKGIRNLWNIVLCISFLNPRKKKQRPMQATSTALACACNFLTTCAMAGVLAVGTLPNLVSDVRMDEMRRL